MAGTEGPHIVLTADTAALVVAPQGAAAEWQGHQWVVINGVHNTNIYDFIPAETALQAPQERMRLLLRQQGWHVAAAAQARTPIDRCADEVPKVAASAAGVQPADEPISA